jgi:RNA polymerase sigma factor (sigma-70 family)
VSFETTQWSLVLEAGGDDSAAARLALAKLCEMYWYPLYAYIRRRGIDAENARDLTQAFLASLLERRDFETLRPEHGRLRAFLLASVRHFLSNASAHARAEKRGGGVIPVPLEVGEAEGRYRHEPVDAMTPETIFDRRWALTVIDQVLAALGAEYQATNRGAEFACLKDSLLGEAPRGGYARIASQLGSTEGAVKVAAHRLRRKFHEELRRLIRESVLDPADVDDEIRYLVRAVSR